MGQSNSSGVSEPVCVPVECTHVGEVQTCSDLDYYTLTGLTWTILIINWGGDSAFPIKESCTLVWVRCKQCELHSFWLTTMCLNRPINSSD